MVRKFIFPVLLFLPLCFASAQQDPAEKKPVDKPKVQQPAAKASDATQPTMKGFVDTNNDGVDDRRQAAKSAGDTDKPGARKRTRMRDNFIDADGDGINDNRCGGMGLQKRAGKGGKGCAN